MIGLRLHDRLVVGSVLGALLMTWAVLLGFDAVFAFAAELNEIGEGDYGAVEALSYVGYTLPRRAYELFPNAAMIGCVLGLGALSASSELTALRAAGLRIKINMVPMRTANADQADADGDGLGGPCDPE